MYVSSFDSLLEENVPKRVRKSKKQKKKLSKSSKKSWKGHFCKCNSPFSFHYVSIFVFLFFLIRDQFKELPGWLAELIFRFSTLFALKIIFSKFYFSVVFQKVERDAFANVTRLSVFTFLHYFFIRDQLKELPGRLAELIFRFFFFFCFVFRYVAGKSFFCT